MQADTKSAGSLNKEGIKQFIYFAVKGGLFDNFFQRQEHEFQMAVDQFFAEVFEDAFKVNRGQGLTKLEYTEVVNDKF